MLEEIKTNIDRLISLYETEKQRSAALEEELGKCRGELEGCKARISDLMSEIDDMRLREAFSGSGDPALAKARITKLIREIDHCIKLLEEE